MKLNKEYPATHSMSTAWYVADEEGNVGIMDFNENCPVPWQTEETSVDYLVFHHVEDNKQKIYLNIDLTDEQIDDLLGTPHSPENLQDVGYWYDCILQIDRDKENVFLELANNQDFEIQFCISKERGLYSVDAGDSFLYLPDESWQIIETSSFKKMLDQDIVIKIFDKQFFDMNDEYDEGRVVHTKIFSSAPYYIFHQPYWTGALPECMNVPEHPVKLEQLPEKLRKRVLRLPIKFKDTKNFQIAEWHPCRVSTGHDSPTEVVDGCEYELLHLTDGTQAYILTDMILPSEFCNYCSEKEKYQCLGCEYYWYERHCYVTIDYSFTSKPTVLAVMNPFEKWDYDRQIKTDTIIPYSVWLPFLPKIPLKLKCKSECSSEKYELDPSEEDIRKHINGRKLLELFQKNRKWLEDWVACFNPRVILISGKAEAVMGTVYPMQDNHIEINGTIYPMYLLSEVETHREEIERLASMPYQGKQIPHIISVEEMDKIKQGK